MGASGRTEVDERICAPFSAEHFHLLLLTAICYSSSRLAEDNKKIRKETRPPKFRPRKRRAKQRERCRLFSARLCDCIESAIVWNWQLIQS